MTDLSYAVRVSQTLDGLLEQLEAESACDDLDLDIVDGVLTVVFEDGAQIIINRQEPVQQIWVASPLGPAHFSFDAGRGVWVDDKTGATLMDTLSQAFTRKLGATVTLKD
ncbi:MAG: iron donor protein CyaY [Gammaproteobacteria bacterium]|nr:iron donor protein CyaY [Gammaproteobacteria bacterium]